MVFIEDDKLKKGVHIWSDLGYLISLFDLFRSIVVTIFFFFKKDPFSIIQLI